MTAVRVALFAVRRMECDQFADIDIADAVAVGEAEGLVGIEILANAPQAPAGLRVFPCVHQGNPPRLRTRLVIGEGVSVLRRS